MENRLGATPPTDLPAPIPEDRTLVASPAAKRAVEKSPHFLGTLTRGDQTFVIFKEKPSDAIIKAMKDAK